MVAKQLQRKLDLSQLILQFPVFKKVRSSFVSELLSNELFLAIVLLSCYRYYLMNLLDEVFQIDEVISEGDTPVESFEWVLGKVLCLNVTIHTDVIEDVLQIAFLL